MDLQKLMAIKKFSMEQTNVSLKLAKQVMSTEAKDKNCVFSPLSVHVLLGLAAAGATGRTLEDLLGYLKSSSSEEFNSLLSQLVTVLFADGTPLGGPQLSTANVVWVAQQFKLKPEFRNIVENAYKNTVFESVDFQNNNKVEESVKKVNQWAEAETNGLIKQLLSSGSVDALTRIILGNAVYFKGAWVIQFPLTSTRDDTFFLANGSSVEVPFMSNTVQYKCFRGFDGFKVVKLAYRQGKDMRGFSMYIFLPDAIDGLPALVEKVTSTPGFIDHHLPYKGEMLKRFRIPKFKICFEFEASKVLKELGLVSVFHDVGFTKMVNEGLFLQSTMHKSFIEVNEHGTEAAAFTYMAFGGGDGSKFPEFVADHPFLFVIREDTTGMLLFIGQVLNPLAE